MERPHIRKYHKALSLLAYRLEVPQAYKLSDWVKEHQLSATTTQFLHRFGWITQTGKDGRLRVLQWTGPAILTVEQVEELYEAMREYHANCAAEKEAAGAAEDPAEDFPSEALAHILQLTSSTAEAVTLLGRKLEELEATQLNLTRGVVKLLQASGVSNGPTSLEDARKLKAVASEGKGVGDVE